MNRRLIALLQRDEDAICEQWMERLSDTARLAGQRLAGQPLTPVRGLLQEVVRGLSGKPVGTAPAPAGAAAGWQVNLCYAVEVLLTGEVVIRNWAYVYLDPGEREQVALFTAINQVFHELLRVSTQQYCQSCHAQLTRER